MAHKPANINLPHGFSIVVTDVSCAVEKEIFPITLIIEEGELIDKEGRLMYRSL
jgi:hypothetical protein